MADSDYFLRHLSAAWRIMATGRGEALTRMEISTEGFWRSFLALLVALPPMALSWFAAAPDYMERSGLSRGAVFARLALSDLAVWIVPIILLAAASGVLKLGKRFAPYIIASNWSGALLAWLIVPPVLFGAFGSEPGSAGEALLLVSAVVTLGLGWRLAWGVFGRDTGYASLIFVLMVALSLSSNVAALQVLGLAPQP